MDRVHTSSGIKLTTLVPALLFAGLALVADVRAQGACGSGPKLAADLWQAYERQTKEAGCYLPWKAGSPESWGPCLREYSKIPLQLGEKMIGVWNAMADNEWATIGPRRIEPDSNHGTLLSPGNRLWLSHTPKFMDEVQLRIDKRKATNPKLLGAEIPLNTRVDVAVCATRADGESEILHREKVLAKEDAGTVVDLTLSDPEPAILSVFLKSTAKVPLTFKYDIQLDVEPKKFNAGRVEGFADVHMHQMADVAYAGLWYWGDHSVPEDQLQDDVIVSKPSDELVALVEKTNPQMAEAIPERFYGHAVPNIFPEDGDMTILHGAPAPDALDGWPRFDDIAHQQANASWLKRAHENGLDLAVVSMVNFQAACFAMRALHPNRNSDRRCADMWNVKRQLEAAQDMAERYEWYEIAVHPWHARKIIDEGKLAVVLSMEISNLLPLAHGSFKAELEELRAMGLRTMQLAHETNSRYAGAATHRKIFRLFEKLKHPFQSKKGFKTDGQGRNLRGLTEEGEELVDHLMDRHMPIDIAHLSIRAVNGLHEMAMERGGYPLYDSHTRMKPIIPNDPPEDKEHEQGKRDEQGEFLTTCRQAQYIEETGGLVGLRTGDTDLLTHVDEHGPVVRNDCPGSSRSFAQLVQFTADQTGLDMAFGTDLNGFITQVGPRFGPMACHRSGEGERVAHAQQQRRKGEASERFGRLGLSHVGYLPDLLTELDSLGIDVRRLEHSAETFLRMWERAWDEDRQPRSVSTRCPGWSDARVEAREPRQVPVSDRTANGRFSVRVDAVRGDGMSVRDFTSGKAVAGAFLEQVTLEPEINRERVASSEIRLRDADFGEDGLIAPQAGHEPFESGVFDQPGRHVLEAVMLDHEDRTHVGHLFFRVVSGPDDIRREVEYELEGRQDVVSYDWDGSRNGYVFTHSRGTEGHGTGQSWTFRGSMVPEVTSNDESTVQQVHLRLDGEPIDNRSTIAEAGTHMLEIYACYNVLAGACDSVEGGSSSAREQDDGPSKRRRHKKKPSSRSRKDNSSDTGPLPPGMMLIARHEITVEEGEPALGESGQVQVPPVDAPTLPADPGKRMPIVTGDLSEAAREWAGTYRGRNDGRRARLTIEPIEEDAVLELQFEDLDRSTSLSVSLPADRVNAEPVHVLENVELSNSDGDRKRFGRLLLHNGGNHIAGHSKWRDNPYGAAFSEEGFESPQGAGGRMPDQGWPRAWAGSYEGFGDGRRVALDIDVAGDRLEIRWRGLDRNVTFTGSMPVNAQEDTPDHVLTDLELTSDDGRTKRIDRLLLHTWDTNYISGNTRWRDKPYGVQFVRMD